MPIGTINNGEPGSSARSKLNSALEFIDTLTQTFSYTGDPTGLFISANPGTAQIGSINVSGLIAVGTFNFTAPGLTSLDLSPLKALTGEFNFTANAMTSLDLSGLIVTGGTGIAMPSVASMTDLDLSSLVSGNVQFNGANSLLSLDLPVFETGGINFVANNLTHFTAPVFRTCAGFGFFPSLGSGTINLVLPAYEGDSGLEAGFGPAGCATISLPAVVNISGGIFCGNGNGPALTSLTMGNTLKRVGHDVDLRGCALTQSCVNALLVQLAGLDGTNGTTTFSNQLVKLEGGTNAVPSGAGLTAKTTLEGRGCTVTTN